MGEEWPRSGSLRRPDQLLDSARTLRRIRAPSASAVILGWRDEAAARAANSPLVRDFGLLIKSATRLEQRIDGALRRECGISHTMLEVLIRLLCRRPGEEVSQRQLADDLTLTSSGTTRLIDRMEEAGLVRRVPSPGDRRVALVEPTGEGRTVFLGAAAAHARVVEEFFVRPLAADDHTRLTAALGTIDRALREQTG